METAAEVMQVKLLRDIDETECARRNALTRSVPNYALQAGQVGALVETLESGSAFLIEFSQSETDSCDWLGVLYANEIEFLSKDAIAA